MSYWYFSLGEIESKIKSLYASAVNRVNSACRLNIAQALLAPVTVQSLSGFGRPIYPPGGCQNLPTSDRRGNWLHLQTNINAVKVAKRWQTAQRTRLIPSRKSISLPEAATTTLVFLSSLSARQSQRRANTSKLSFETVVLKGLAADGGLFLPHQIPTADKWVCAQLHDYRILRSPIL